MLLKNLSGQTINNDTIILLTPEILEEHMQMYLNLIECPSSYEMALVSFLQDLIINSTAPQFLLTLSELMTTMDEDPLTWSAEREGIRLLFNDLTDLLELKHGHLRSLIAGKNSSSSGL